MAEEERVESADRKSAPGKKSGIVEMLKNALKNSPPEHQAYWAEELRKAQAEAKR